MNIFHCMVHCHRGFMSRLRNAWYRLLGVEINGYVWMQSVSIPRNWSDIRIERDVALDDGVVLLCSGLSKKNSKIVISNGTYINRYTMIDAHSSIEIGQNCMIGPQCYITDSDHGKDKSVLIKKQPIETIPVKIEDNVWLGAGVIVLKGVTIGKGAIIGAGSVITKSVVAGAIITGIPARQINPS